MYWYLSMDFTELIYNDHFSGGCYRLVHCRKLKEKHAAISMHTFQAHFQTDEIFANINTAFHQDGAFVHCEKTKADPP